MCWLAMLFANSCRHSKSNITPSHPRMADAWGKLLVGCELSWSEDGEQGEVRARLERVQGSDVGRHGSFRSCLFKG